MAIRFNNAGNIRTFYKNGSWSKPFIGEVLPPLASVGATSGFRKFATLPLGYRALFIVLKQNYLNKGLDTIAEIFPVYAPSGDGSNNPQAYINLVEKKSGIDRNKILKTYSDLIPIVEAITEVETGTKANKDAILQGYKFINSPPLIDTNTIEYTTPSTENNLIPKENFFVRNKKPILITGITLALLTTLYLYNEKKTSYS